MLARTKKYVAVLFLILESFWQPSKYICKHNELLKSCGYLISDGTSFGVYGKLVCWEPDEHILTDADLVLIITYINMCSTQYI